MDGFANVLMEKHLKSLKDWRVDFIKQKTSDDHTACDIWRILQLAMEKLTSSTERLIYQNRHDVTEVCA